MISRDRADLPARRQCALVGLARSGVYRKPAAPDPEELVLIAVDQRAVPGDAVLATSSRSWPIRQTGVYQSRCKRACWRSWRPCAGSSGGLSRLQLGPRQCDLPAPDHHRWLQTDLVQRNASDGCQLRRLRQRAALLCLARPRAASGRQAGHITANGTRARHAKKLLVSAGAIHTRPGHQQRR